MKLKNLYDKFMRQNIIISFKLYEARKSVAVSDVSNFTAIKSPVTSRSTSTYTATKFLFTSWRSKTDMKNSQD